MNELHIAENIVRIRKEKGVTQEEMADFLGVTKASVSKWETGKSMPDIVMLPTLAAYLGMTVDELLGYEPQLDNEEILEIYKKLMYEFTEEPFETVYKKSWTLVKKYYTCYPFLFQMTVLWLNHFYMADSEKRRIEILNDILKLCRHIKKNCREYGVGSDVAAMEAMVELQLHNYEAVIEELGDILSPDRLINQSDTILVQAYEAAGQSENALLYSQVYMFIHLLELISDATGYLSLNMSDKEVCDTTIERIDIVIRTYDLEQLHPNVVGIYYYVSAIAKCMQEDYDEVIKRLKKFVENVNRLLKWDKSICGDKYFTKVGAWFEEKWHHYPVLVRDKKLIIESLRENMNNPIFDVIKENPEFIRLKLSI